MGKTVLVTGSSRGIGKAIALEFAKEGYSVILNSSKSLDELKKTQNEFKKMGYITDAFLADVSSYSECSNMFNSIYSIYNNIDILVNNAGIALNGLFQEQAPKDWQRVLNTNINSVLNCTHIVIPKMVGIKSGTIINISSIWGERGASCEAIYSASKGAINSFTKALAKELGPSNIRVNAIACGVIDTAMNNNLSKDEKAELADEISLMRFGTPKEIAGVALFLASGSSSYLTGQIITVDGCMF